MTPEIVVGGLIRIAIIAKFTMNYNKRSLQFLLALYHLKHEADCLCKHITIQYQWSVLSSVERNLKSEGSSSSFSVCFTPQGRADFGASVLHHEFWFPVCSVLMGVLSWTHRHEEIKVGTFLLSTTDVTISTQLGTLVPGKAEAQWLWGEGASCESACSLVRLRDVGQWWWGGCGGVRPVWSTNI